MIQSIDILIPCFNEAKCLRLLFDRLKKTCLEISDSKWTLILVNDGSRDETLDTATELLSTNEDWISGKLIDFSRNFGKEAAILAGLDHSTSDACIIMDADLQDPPELIPRMVEAWRKGVEVVSATRESREHDGYIKRQTARNFYKVFQLTSKLSISHNASDFRLIDKRVAEAIRSCRESIRFSKGFFAWAGFTESSIYFKRPERAAGITKWGSWKLWNYALDGIFNYSTAPLRIWSYMGLSITAISFAFGIRTAVAVYMDGVKVPGYASIFAAVTFLGGIQLIGIGILGEYLGRTYLETKRRPPYVLRSVKLFTNTKSE